ncbi:LytTR family DNA-binding domain-containing protein [Pseudoprimorskyibacter insulae]|nr:LytTR family DNA-binding domain-containing protein [Pseudoprimorskyibacter insulae]
MVLFSLCVALLNAPMMPIPLGLPSRFLVFLAICYLATGFWIALYCVIIFANRRFGTDIPMPNIVSNFGGLFVAVLVKYLIARVGFGLPWPGGWTIFLESLRYAVIATVCEFLTVAFMLPQFEGVSFLDQATEKTDAPEAPADDATAQSPQASAAPNAAVVHLKNRTIPASNVIYMKSVEHYVEFVTDTGTFMERATLKDLTESLPETDGLQTHRSFWVNRKAADRIERRNGNSVLLLRDGTEIPVARSRRTEVAEWLEQVG